MEDNKVGRFRSIHLEHDKHGTAVTASTPYQKPLPELVDWWYSHCLGYGDRPMTKPLKVLDLALKRQSISVGIGQICQYVSQNVNPGIADTLMNMFTTYHTAALRAENSRNILAMEQERNENVARAPTAALQPPKKKRRTEGSTEIERRDEISMLEGSAKLDLIRDYHQQLLEKVGGKKQRLDEKSKRFYNRHVPKILTCLDDHCGGNVQRFLQTYGQNFKTTKHECKCVPEAAEATTRTV